jgi:hypothetical protein
MHNYREYLRGNKQFEYINLMKGHGISYPGELLERYHEKKGLVNDQHLIFEALLAVANQIDRNDVQDNQLELFLDSIEKDDLITRLSKQIIRMSFYKHHNETDKSDQAYLKLITEEIIINSTEESLKYAKMLDFLSDESLKYELLGKADNFLHYLTEERDLDVLEWDDFKYIPLLYTKEKEFLKKIDKDLVKFIRLVRDMQEKVINEATVEKLFDYNLNAIELYYLNYISLDIRIVNYDNKKEKAAALFIFESFNSGGVIKERQLSLVKEFYSNHRSFSRKIDGTEGMKEYLRENLFSFKDIENYPMALSLFQELFPCFLNIEVENKILGKIEDRYFDNIVLNKLSDAESKEEAYKIINVFNKRYNISFIKDVLIEDKRQMYVSQNIVENLIAMDIFDYKMLDFNVKKKENYTVQNVLSIISDYSLPIHFEMFFYLMENYGLKLLNKIIDERYALKVFEENITGLSIEELRKFYNIVEESLFYRRDEKDFIKFVYNIFRIDTNFNIKSKEEWKKIMYKLKKADYLSAYQVEYVREIFLTKDDLEKIKKEELERKEKQRVKNLIENINKADEAYSLYSAVYYPSDIKKYFHDIKSTIMERINYFMTNCEKDRDKKHLYELLVYLYSFDGISRNEFIDHIDLVKGAA